MSAFSIMFKRVEDRLWATARDVNPDYRRQRYDGWVLCPREHAKAHLRCILELTSTAYPGLPGLLWLAKQQFGTVNRYFEGEDLVFAVGDIQ